ncbi:MAG: ABC transporter permease subunit [Myxococcota bacterium]
MQGALTIAGKELWLLITTPVSYLLAAAYLLLSGFFFERLVVQFQGLVLQYRQRQQLAEQLNVTEFIMTPLFFWMVVFLMLMLPLLTMRLFAEERRSQTLELLLTSPVSLIDIVLGKYLGALTLMLALIASTLVFPLVLVSLGTSPSGAVLDLRTVASGYLGVVLIGSAVLSLGMFISTLTDSQLVAALSSMTLSILWVTVGVVSPSVHGLWRAVLSHVSFSEHIDHFARGLIQLDSIVYYGTVTGLGWFLSYRVLDLRRWRA